MHLHEAALRLMLVLVFCSHQSVQRLLVSTPCMHANDQQVVVGLQDIRTHSRLKVLADLFCGLWLGVRVVESSLSENKISGGFYETILEVPSWRQ